MTMSRLALAPLFAAMLALAACGQNDAGAGDGGTTGGENGGGEGGGGAMTAQLRATCVSQLENNATLSAAAAQICDCATRRARENLSVTDLMAGEASGLQDIVAQCADEALGLGTTETNSSRTET